jgi:hypothetical protein
MWIYSNKIQHATPSKGQFSASGTELKSQIVPLVSFSRLELVHMDQSTQLVFREVLVITGSSLGFSLVRVKNVLSESLITSFYRCKRFIWILSSYSRLK